MPSFSILYSWHTYAHRHPKRGSKWTHESPKKQSYFAKKCYFWSLFSRMKVTCMPIVCFMCSPFVLNAYSFRSLLVAYACTFPSKQGFKKDILASKKCWYFAKKKVLLKLNFKHKGHLYTNYLFYIYDIILYYNIKLILL